MLPTYIGSLYNKIESPPVNDTQKFKMTGKKVNRPKIKDLEVKEHMALQIYPIFFETTQLASLLNQQRTEVFDNLVLSFFKKPKPPKKIQANKIPIKNFSIIHRYVGRNKCGLP